VSPLVLLFSYTHTYKYTLTHFSRPCAACSCSSAEWCLLSSSFSVIHINTNTLTHTFLAPLCCLQLFIGGMVSSFVLLFSYTHTYKYTLTHIYRTPVLLAAVHRRNGVFFRPPFQLYTYIQIHTHTHLSRPCAACSCSSAEWCLLSSSFSVIHIHTNTHSHTFLAPLCCLQLFIGGMVSSFILLFSYTHTYKYTLTHTFSRAPVLLAAVHRRNGVFFRPLLLFSYTHTYKYTHTHISRAPVLLAAVHRRNGVFFRPPFQLYTYIQIHTHTHFLAPLCCLQLFIGGMVSSFVLLFSYTHTYKYTLTHISRAPVLLAAVHRRNGVFFRPLLLFSYTHTYKYTHTHIFSRPCTACSCSSAEWCLLSSSFSVTHIHTNTHTHTHLSRPFAACSCSSAEWCLLSSSFFVIHIHTNTHSHTFIAPLCCLQLFIGGMVSPLVLLFRYTHTYKYTLTHIYRAPVLLAAVHRRNGVFFRPHRHRCRSHSSCATPGPQVGHV